MEYYPRLPYIQTKVHTVGTQRNQITKQPNAHTNTVSRVLFPRTEDILCSGRNITTSIM
jgi:hypothetical protein